MNNPFLLTYAFLLAIGNSAYAAPSCGGLSNEPEQIECYLAELRTADSDLNAKYAQVYKTINAKTKADLRHMQRKWLASRDDICGLKDIDKTKPNWSDDLSTDKKKIWCVTRVTQRRKKELSAFSSDRLPIDPNSDICDAVKASIEADADRLWLNVRDPSRTQRHLNFVPPGNDQWARLYLDDGNALKLESHNLGDWAKYETKVDAAFVDIDGDYVDEILLEKYLNRTEGAEHSVLKRSGDSYEVVPGGHLQLIPVYYREKIYLVGTVREYIGPTTGLRIFHLYRETIQPLCEISISYGPPNIRSNCKNEEICQAVQSDSRLFSDDVYEIWDQTAKDDTTTKDLSKILGKGFEYTKNTLIDIDNDGRKEIAVVNYSLPPWFHPFPFFFKKADGKYERVDERKTWLNFTAPGSRLRQQGRRLFVKNGGRKNYVIVRDKVPNVDSRFGKTFKFYVVLAQENKVERVGEVIAEYAKQIEIKR